MPIRPGRSLTEDDPPLDFLTDNCTCKARPAARGSHSTRKSTNSALDTAADRLKRLTIGRRVYHGRHGTKVVVVVKKKGGTSRDFWAAADLWDAYMNQTGIGVDRFSGNNRDYHHPGGGGDHASTRKEDERTQ